MQENGGGVVVVDGVLLRQLPQVGQGEAPLQVLGVVEAVGGEHPARELLGAEAVEVGQAGHAVLEVAVAEGAREVELPVDAVLLPLLQHYPSSVYHRHEFLLVAQVVGRGQLGHLALGVHPEELAVAQVGHHQQVAHLQQHQRSGPLLVLFYNFSLHLREHYIFHGLPSSSACSGCARRQGCSASLCSRWACRKSAGCGSQWPSITAKRRRCGRARRTHWVGDGLRDRGCRSCGPGW